MAAQLFLKHVLRKVFLEDLGLKLIAFAVTLGLWFAVTGLSTPTTTRFSNVPLTMQILNNTDITNSPIGEVDIVVSGDARRINRINKSGLVASLDLTSMQPGERTISLSPANVFVDLPTGVKLDDISPNKLAIRLEAIEEKEVPVRAEIDGETSAGTEIYTRVVTPARVRVRGPQSVLKQLEYVSTEKIDVTGRSEDLTMRQVMLSPTNTKAAIQDASVDVFLRIGEKRIERPFTAAITGEPGRSGSFLLYGPRTLLQKAKPSDLKIEFVLGSDGVEVPRVILPPELADIVEVRRLKAVR